jgi:hypothetical protein
MATKNLSRTAIEGGRYGFYKIERIESLRTVRRENRAALKYCASHSEWDIDPTSDADELDLSNRTPPQWGLGKFRDRLNPVKRWMASRVGLSWDETYSLLRSRFDARTTPGRHILFDHMVDLVWTSQDHSAEIFKYHDYYVDEQGLLQKMEEDSYRVRRLEERRQRRADRLPADLDRVEKDKILKWLGEGRRIGWVGNQYFWYVPTRAVPKTARFSWGSDRTLSKLRVVWGYYSDRGIPSWGWYYPLMGLTSTTWEVFNPTYRQDKPFSKEDLKFFFSLSPANQQYLQGGRPRTSREILDSERRRYGLLKRP